MNEIQRNDLNLPNLVERASKPTPVFFRKLRNTGLILSAIAGVILTTPIQLPAVVVSVAGYLIVASGILSAVSQVTVEGEG
ncbi:MAG: hypothetical protein IPI30_19410 [Saprospiraceae bacterium]|nr:hypothetical protein [Candidatus Vicinibacter affinis]MBK7696393.1 hypothetical protein [Candidatus Vicinibacter affinis]